MHTDIVLPGNAIRGNNSISRGKKRKKAEIGFRFHFSRENGRDISCDPRCLSEAQLCSAMTSVSHAQASKMPDRVSSV